MPIGSDSDILAAVSTYIASREPGAVLNFHYNRVESDPDDALRMLAGMLPIEEIATVQLVHRLNVPPLSMVVILLATLLKIRTSDPWIHYNLTKHLNALIDADVAEARLPAIIHAQLAIEGLKIRAPDSLRLPLAVMARSLATFAPREAIRNSILAQSDEGARELKIPGPALAALGLERTPALQAHQLAKALNLGIDVLPRTTSLANAVGLHSTMVEPSRRATVPPVQGDDDHYMFAREGGGPGRKVTVPAITVTTIEDGIFSIDAMARGHVRHYVFDGNGDCVRELAKGSEPFIAETVLELDEPVAILDDLFSSGMNICHFLLDHVTRIAIYDRAWSLPGKFLLVDDYPYYREIFARMGLADRVIFSPFKRVSVRAPAILFSSNILDTGIRRPAHYCAAWAIDFLRRALHVEERPARPGRKLVISRGDATGRRILNWQEILPVFQRHDFEVVELGNLSADAQIELFHDAAQVAAVHGAGLTNLVFAPRNCAVLEILPPLVAGSEYWLLASSLGQRYTALIAEDPELPRPDYTTWQRNWIYLSRDIVLPVGRLEAALAAA